MSKYAGVLKSFELSITPTTALKDDQLPQILRLAEGAFSTRKTIDPVYSPPIANP